MKTNKYILSLAAAGIMGLSSCVNDLDVLPLDSTVVTADKAYKDAESYTKGLNKIYSVWALSGQDGVGSSDIHGLDAGNTALLRCWWTLQEQSTDEMKNAWNDAWCNEINTMTWSTNKVEPIEGVYQRCMYIVSLVNEFMKNIPNAPEGIDKASYSAQARFHRAFAYYVLMDMFAIPPFITEENYSITPKQKERKDLFAWIEGELNTIMNDLPETRSEYGRADKATAQALLARMYLNAEVYTGTARWNDCVKACKEVISGGYELAPVYEHLFMADNGDNEDTKKEIIFPIIFDGNKTQSYGMTALIVGSRTGTAEELLASSGVREGWSGFRATGQLVDLFDFENNEDKKAAEIKDCRGIFVDTDRQQHITSQVNGTFNTEGWMVFKYTNLNRDKQPRADQTLWVDTDFPMFRLADIYLMYAEAVAKGATEGDMTTAVGYINELRARAYGNGNHSISEQWLKENNFRNILDERGRELYWEGVRRTDLIRFGLFTSASYVWDFKGGVANGVGVDEKFNLYPIPVTDITVNDALDQNPGYDKSTK